MIEEHIVATDQRILARVSGEEARTYIRGVNAHIAKSTRCYRWSMRGCVASFFLGAVLFGVMMGVFHEEKRLRCKGRLCKRGEDPLVDGCCVYWCCGRDMPQKECEGEGACYPELPARPWNNTRWDVWANETFFGITKRCSLYDDGDRPEDHTKRDADYGSCESCPAEGVLEAPDDWDYSYGNSWDACKMMYEGKAKNYEVVWPLMLLIPFVGGYSLFLGLLCAYGCKVPRLYKGAFEDWRARGVVAQVTMPCRTHLRLWFVGGADPDIQYARRGPDRIIRDASQEIVRLNLPMVLREGGCSRKNGIGLVHALPFELVGRVPEEVWIRHIAKLGPIFKRLRSNATNAWCGAISGIFLLASFFLPAALNIIHGKYITKKVNEDLRAWQTSFNADLAYYGVFVKTQSCVYYTRDSEDGIHQSYQRWLAVALTENEAADLKAEPHLFGSSADNIFCFFHQKDVCLHTMQ